MLYSIDDLDISQFMQIYLVDLPQKETEIKKNRNELYNFGNS